MTNSIYLITSRSPFSSLHISVCLKISKPLGEKADIFQRGTALINSLLPGNSGDGACAKIMIYEMHFLKSGQCCQLSSFFKAIEEWHNNLLN